jgi:hypothetical protein
VEHGTPARAPATAPRSVAAASPHARWWDYARGCAGALRAGYPPPALAVYGPLMYPREAARVCAPAGCARLIGGDGQHQQVSLLLRGSPAVLVGSLVAQRFINHRRRRRARRDAVPRWQPCGKVTVIVTTHRLLCTCSDYGWLSFWFDDVDEFYPELHRHAVSFGFGHQSAPLRLHGPAVSALALWSAVGVLGDRWVGDPRLAALLDEDGRPT